MDKQLQIIRKWLEESDFGYEEKEIPWGISLKLKDQKVSINLYDGKKGFRWVLQGGESSFHQELQEEISLLFSSGSDSFASSSQKDVFASSYSFPFMGSDESGKGDIFGPLVFCGFLMKPQNLQKMLSLGIRDSKSLKDKDILSCAPKIRSAFPGQFKVLSLVPRKYNELYEKFKTQGKNLNHLMGWGHARVYQDLYEKYPEMELVVIDQFASPQYVTSITDFRKPENLSFLFRTKAEENLAVAAASILAREKLLYWHEDCSKTLGFSLPMGAGGICREFLRRFSDEEKLADYAKLHFQPVVDYLRDL